MPPSPYRLVLDTNTVVRAFVNIESFSGQILTDCQLRRMLPLLSSPVLDEYRSILRRRELVERFPELTRPEVFVSLERLRYVSDYYRRITTRFSLPRDPRDEPFIELAISGQATHLITTDRDLLSLMNRHDDASRRFRKQLPRTSVLTPQESVRQQQDAISS